MSSTRSNLVELTLQLHHETDRAILVSDGDAKVWLAKSQCEHSPANERGIVQVTLPEWLATEKGLV